MRTLSKLEISQILALATDKPFISHNARIVDLGDGRLLNKASDSRTECEAMEFIRTNTRIPVPAVDAIFEDESTGASYILMDGVLGNKIAASAMYTMSKEDSHKLASQVQEQVIGELRSLGHRMHPTTRTFGRWPEGPFGSYAVFPDASKPVRVFENGEDFIAYWKRTYRQVAGNESDQFDRLSECIYHDAPSRRLPVISHGDLRPDSLILDDNGDLLAVMDWEELRWYPDFWDPCWYLGGCHFPNAINGAASALGTFSPAEYALLELIRVIHLCLWVY